MKIKCTLHLQHFPLTLTVVFNKRFKLQSLVDFGGRHIYHDSHEKTEINRICSDHMDSTMKSYLVKITIIAFSYAVSTIGPMSAFILHGIYTTALELRIPFTEPKGNAEFAVNFFIQSLLAIHGFISYAGIELVLSLLENAVTITPRLIVNDLVQTIQSYEKSLISKGQLHLQIGNIVNQSIDADK